MDKSIVVVDESRWIGDSVASTVRPLESVVGVNLTSVDFGCATEEIDSPLHEHFSIRGYVDGMRKKDPKVCLPFALEDGLPPLHIPTFRWWNCPTSCPHQTNVLFLQKEQTAGCAKNSDIGGDEAKNVSSEELWGKTKSKSELALISYAGAETSSKDQTSCRLRDIPDLNETPPNTQDNDHLSLFKLLNACRAIISTNNQEMEAHEAPYNMERRKRRARQQILDLPQTNGLGVLKTATDTNVEDTRSAGNASPNSPTSLNASTQGEMRPHLESIVASEVYTLNRNPADFSFPDAVNEFTINPQDLNPRKRKYRLSTN